MLVPMLMPVFVPVAQPPCPARAGSIVAQAANRNSATQTSRPAVQTNVRSVPRFAR